MTPRSKPIALCIFCASLKVALSIGGYGGLVRGGNFAGSS
jgi:hypothetical protein